MRLKDKVAIIVGAGQQPGETMGNGRAVAIRFAQEGARLLLVDNNAGQVEDTRRICEEAGAEASTLVADITAEANCQAIATVCVQRYGRIDVLHNNVGRSRGDTETPTLDAAMWNELVALNLTGMFLTIKHVLPVMREQGSGAIINISSTASLSAHNTVAYKTTKGAVNTLTHHVAMENAPYGVRCNAILPGLMDTPMAIERRARERNVDREVIRQERNARVPLLKRMGTAWDVANAAVFLASDEANYITAVCLPVDGGMTGNVG
jgi:NAD(P)-dependent dehydrogenase (short-subunit alcohol dehydrogenase family)